MHLLRFLNKSLKMHIFYFLQNVSFMRLITLYGTIFLKSPSLLNIVSYRGILITIMFSVLSTSIGAFADTIDNYVSIANHITSMEMKADRDAQTWARSARNVLAITNESIAETLIEANRIATNDGHPIFCLAKDATLDASIIKSLLEKALKTNPELQNDKTRPTISVVATNAVRDAFPCKTNIIGGLH